jgi:phosphotransferase system enzyme I (PtsI)
MAGDVRYTGLLLALGLTDFSMHPGLLLEVREAVNRFDRSRLLGEARELLRARSRQGIERVMERLTAHALAAETTAPVPAGTA